MAARAQGAGVFLLAAALVASLGSGAIAQDHYSAGTMWGTTTTDNAVDSAQSHYLDGLSAGHVNAARDGILYGDGSIFSITSIGSQNVISNTIIDSDNVDIDIDADQSSSNSGDISTEGTFHYSPTTVNSQTVNNGGE